MISKLTAVATLPAASIEQSRKYYSEKLGLTPDMVQPDDIEREMKELRSKGVVFEQYDMPGLKTVHGVATMGDGKAAWFKDSEGNTWRSTRCTIRP